MTAVVAPTLDKLAEGDAEVVSNPQRSDVIGMLRSILSQSDDKVPELP